MRNPALHLRPLPVLLVFAGGAVGTLSRYLLGLVVPQPGGFPLPTFLVNIVGAFALGFLLEALLRGGNDEGWRQRVRLLLGPGFLGGFTTYSSLCVETVLATEDGQYVLGGVYAVASLLLGVAAAASGVWVAANVFAVPEARPGAMRSTVTATQLLNLAQQSAGAGAGPDAGSSAGPAESPPGAWIDPDAERLGGGAGDGAGDDRASDREEGIR